ncbi:MAG: DNA-deoxyinosine glycosylase [Firmicutes bacterium]|nr:DNA-deoxyinosine glycosylase [Bacillota bacterium]
MIYSLPPVAGQNPKILILGSMPGKESLRAQRYYNHPRNRFWPFLFGYFKCNPTDNYEAKKALLTGNGIALWDVIERCERKTSLDSDIKDSVPNDIEDFLNTHPVQAILLNGGKAWAEFQKRFNWCSAAAVIPLPSTSPANAGWNKKNCQQEWANALDMFLR